MSDLGSSSSDDKRKRADKTRLWFGFFGSIIVVFLITGIHVLMRSQIWPIEVKEGGSITGPVRISFGIHLMAWMLLGMLANYWWDHFRAGRDWDDMDIRQILLPVLVSPIIYFSVWSTWSGKELVFSSCLMAFQTGFFWQVVFSRSSGEYGDRETVANQGKLEPKPDPPPKLDPPRVEGT